MPTIRLDIEYDGTGFSGWAAQPGLRTIQGELERALETVLREPVQLAVAGRTDAGVHARGQVASFPTSADPPPTLSRSINGILGPEVSLIEAAVARDGFDARRDARSRTYCYRILARSAPSPFERNRGLWWPNAIDREALDRCADVLVGTHDFTAFTPTETEHVRFERNLIRAEWIDRGSILELWVEADAFMRKMVRILVGTMLEVGEGKRSVADFERLLAGAARPQAGPTASAHGLYLASVSYD